MIFSDLKQDIHRRPFMFDGSVPHGTSTYQGERIALVAFTRKVYPGISNLDLQILMELGFPVPDVALVRNLRDKLYACSLAPDQLQPFEPFGIFLHFGTDTVVSLSIALT